MTKKRKPLSWKDEQEIKRLRLNLHIVPLPGSDPEFWSRVRGVIHRIGGDLYVARMDQLAADYPENPTPPLREAFQMALKALVEEAFAHTDLHSTRRTRRLATRWYYDAVEGLKRRRKKARKRKERAK